MDKSEDLVGAFLRTSDGAWREVGWTQVRDWRPEMGLLWVHLDREGEQAKRYLLEESALDSLVSEALLAEETRPRSLNMEDRLLLVMRGVNLNPGADPDDMVSIRLWVESKRMISTRHRPLMAVKAIREGIESGRGPDDAGDLLLQLIAGLTDRMSGVVNSLDENEDELEELLLEQDGGEIRLLLAGVRRQAISLRRYLAPQRDALNRLQGEEFTWLDKRDKARLREVTDRVIRHVEDLDAIRERAAVIQDELMSRQSDRMNKNMYVLTIVATIMLPLGFLTGLLGINVDGMPGAEDTPWAFALVCSSLVALVAAEIWLFKRLKWF